MFLCAVALVLLVLPLLRTSRRRGLSKRAWLRQATVEFLLIIGTIVFWLALIPLFVAYGLSKVAWLFLAGVGIIVVGSLLQFTGLVPAGGAPFSASLFGVFVVLALLELFRRYNRKRSTETGVGFWERCLQFEANLQLKLCDLVKDSP